MTKEEKIDLLKFSIDRCDLYYDSINNKGNLYLTLCTFLLGGIITGYYSVKEDQIFLCFPHTLIWAALFFNLLSIILTLIAIKPYLSKKNIKKSKVSLFYFGDISSITDLKFKEIYNKADSSSMYDDLLNQIGLLSIGLRQKFFLLKMVTYLIIAEFTIITIIALYILK